MKRKSVVPEPQTEVRSAVEANPAGGPMRVLDYFALATLLVLVLASSVLVAMGLRNVWHAIASEGWPRVPGTVVRSGLRTDEVTDPHTHEDWEAYIADITFRYYVNGHEYTTDLLHFGQIVGSGSPADAELRHLRYPLGGKVMISYKPSDPSIAAAEPGFAWESLLLVVAGLGFMLPFLMGGVLYYSTVSGSRYRSVGSGIVTILFGSVFATAGIAALAGGLIGLSRARNSEHWPKAPGVIRYSDLLRDQPTERGASSSYSANLVYEFEVEGQKYFGRVRRFGVFHGDLPQEAGTAQRYTEGTAVQVAYLPTNPNLACLEPGVEKATYTLAIAGSALLLFATAIFVFIVPGEMRPH
jgi:hypothetical protein